MAGATDLGPTIGTAAGTPAAAAADGLSATARPIGQLVQADTYLAAKAARAQKRRGLMFAKVIPAAAMPDSQGTGVGLGSFDSPGGIV